VISRKAVLPLIVFLIVASSVAVGQPKLVLNTTSIDFGNVKVGVYDPHTGWTTILLTNAGTDTLRVSSISSSDAAFFAQPTSAVIPAGGSFVDTLRFVPAVAGSITGQLTIVSNDPQSPATLPLQGFGISGGVVDAKTQAYRNDEKGNVQYRKEGIMDGNRIVTLFNNDGEVGHWPFQPSAVWPKGTDHSYLDGVALLIASKFVAPGNGRLITPMVSAYREEVSADPVTGEQWVLQPVPGYVNSSSTRPAINKDPSSWPPVWPPALGLTSVWDGYWYGYFGRGISNADFETYFVMDDSKMKKFSRPPFSYYPIASDSGRAGLGMRVEVRGFQWSHVLAEDIIFWHYDIVNISDHDYDTTCFGFYTDPGVGGTNNSGNDARYNTKLDLAYAWCHSGLGTPGNYKTGYVGYAYLESPGNPWNGIDDDEDGMIDERRDDNIDNNHNWIAFSDLNHNGKWDAGEPLNDDVGRDGVGPQDVQYTGPDEGEGDGIPTHGEPNFDETDKDESDQIGLQAISIYVLADKGPTGGWPKNDDVMWGKMNNGFKDTVISNTNISMVFSSGPFPWKQTRRERFSMALVFGDDLDGLIFNKQTVQDIYNANYNFSKPPYTPRLTAVPGDGKVFLYWDGIAETSVDRYLGFEDPTDPSKGYKKNFEGYLVYRSTEPEFNDIKVITDSKGTPKYWKPIAQFDLVDSISGPDPVGINGAHFWRGANTGLQHSYIDTDVKNGIRYYYAVVSYSKGAPTRGTVGLQPTECTKIITVDYAGNLKFVDINCAVVTPNPPSAGYKAPETSGDLAHVTQGLGTGRLDLVVFNPSQVNEGDEYTFRFKADTVIPLYKSKSCDVMRLRGGVTDTLLHDFPAANFGTNNFTPPFDGLVVSVLNDTVVTVNDSLTGWLVGNSNIRMQVRPDSSISSRNVAWPSDYEMRWFPTIADTTAFNAPPRYPLIPVNFTITNTTTGQRVKFIIDDRDNSTTLTLGDTIRVLDGYVGPTNFKIAYRISYGRPFGPVIDPQAGDRFVIKTNRPFYTGDYFAFRTHAARSDLSAAKDALSQIAVVPNPYIATAKWEPRTLYSTGRGERRIEFKKLPAKCTLRIYTIAGALVKTLYKDSTPTDGSLFWDLVSDDGMDIAYGLYIFHVDAPGVGEYIGKFAVVK
jgi:hypothetical protein